MQLLPKISHVLVLQSNIDVSPLDRLRIYIYIYNRILFVNYNISLKSVAKKYLTKSLKNLIVEYNLYVQSFDWFSHSSYLLKASASKFLRTEKFSVQFFRRVGSIVSLFQYLHSLGGFNNNLQIVEGSNRCDVKSSVY